RSRPSQSRPNWLFVVPRVPTVLRVPEVPAVPAVPESPVTRARLYRSVRRTSRTPGTFGTLGTLERLKPLRGAGRYNSGGVLPLLEMRGISKMFPGVRALDSVSLTADAGTVHVLLGQNGAGKSTLMRILCGAHHPDTGEILIDGRAVRLQSPVDARRLGIAVIFQEFSLVPHLDLAQNVFLGREPVGRIPGTIDRRKMHSDARHLLDGLGLDVDTRTPAHELGIAQQQVVEIAKALSQNARILVMDEPTAALSDRESERLFDRVRILKRDGVGI